MEFWKIEEILERMLHMPIKLTPCRRWKLTPKSYLDFWVRKVEFWNAKLGVGLVYFSLFSKRLSL